MATDIAAEMANCCHTVPDAYDGDVASSSFFLQRITASI
jgi:hypothetical protein